MIRRDWRGAIAAWRAELGDSAVATGARCRDAERTMFAACRRVEAVVSPGSIDDVRSCLRVAQQYAVTLYPSSSGKNWGYGSQAPVEDQSAVLSLHRLDAIEQLDPELGTVTIGPGVSFEQLNMALQAKGSVFCLAAPGSTAAASVIGNLVERGVLPTTDEDASWCVLGLRVVLPTGELLQVGSFPAGSFPTGSLPASSPSDGQAPSPDRAHTLGPDLKGLFIQSNLGCVVSARIALPRRPSMYRTGLVRVQHPATLACLLNAMQQLKLKRLIQPQVVVYNDFKLLAMQRRFPFELTASQTPLPMQLLEAFRRQHGGARWLCAFGVGAETRGLLEGQMSVIEREVQRAEAAVEYLPEGSDLFYDLPTQRNASSVYWRKRSAPSVPEDPLRDGCGVLWSTAVLAFRGEEVVALAEQATRLVYDGGFEPLVSILATSYRYAYLVVGLSFDRLRPGEDDQATHCHERLQALLLRRGHLPYRCGINTMNAVSLSQHPSASRLLRELRQLVDPAGVLAPGRYHADNR